MRSSAIRLTGLPPLVLSGTRLTLRPETSLPEAVSVRRLSPVLSGARLTLCPETSLPEAFSIRRLSPVLSAARLTLRSGVWLSASLFTFSAAVSFLFLEF